MVPFASQIALPLVAGVNGPSRIIVGAANSHIVEALTQPGDWPFHTAVLTGPERSGKSLFARWFRSQSLGAVVDDAQDLAEDQLFHRWNRAQQDGRPLLIVSGAQPWTIRLPDLASRMGAALQLEIRAPDDAMARDLLMSLAMERGLSLGPDAADYLIPRSGRSYAEFERLVAAIDRLSLERKVPATLSIWRAALEMVLGPEEPQLF